jgi:hypothetical protein
VVEDNLVAALDKGVLRFRPIKVASTDGAVVSLLAGRQPGEKIVIDVPDEAINGGRMQPFVAVRAQ